MTNSDYIRFADSSHAHIHITYSANDPLVSLQEAQRLEKETADELLNSRKLSLIVDLDQTWSIPLWVGEWRAEGAAWKACQAAKPEDDTEPDEECNPNWKALEPEDVGEFRLTPEIFCMSGKGKSKMMENDFWMRFTADSLRWSCRLNLRPWPVGDAIRSSRIWHMM
ncbi:hypothetical protein FB45DRAFT_436969 [Roridomyces roridus]|uniref:Uncharacterized protein n=1 Tax=Roridomyces roridus TaxID=1738132 RepID=A0AAD7B1A4_9AGAR|nr:hypothetical protein FB45DRAFT_436969 [Roridomyces roridus]